MKRNIRRTGKGKAIAVGLAMILGMTGCGKDTEVAEQPEEITAEADEAYVEEEKKQPETLKNKDTEEKGPEADREDQNKPKEEKTEKEEVELTGSVRSVGADSFVVSQTTTEHHEDYDIAVGVAPGASGEVLVTVYVTDAAVYQYTTVKNSGINPEDITSREGSYEDLQEGLNVILKGRWEKDAFYAEELELMKFI